MLGVLTRHLQSCCVVSQGCAQCQFRDLPDEIRGTCFLLSLVLSAAASERTFNLNARACPVLELGVDAILVDIRCHLNLRQYIDISEALEKSTSSFATCMQMVS